MIEVQQFSVVPVDDLHYRIEDPHTGETLASVEPVSMGEAYREGFFKRYMRPGRRGSYLPGVEYYIPRIVLRVADASDATLFFIDRAPKALGNACTPHYAAVAADGEVIGYITNDHYKIMPPNLSLETSGGITSIAGVHYLRDSTQNAICEIILRRPTPEFPGTPGPDIDQVRYVGQDGAIWAKSAYGGSTTDFAPDLPHHLRQQIIAHAVGYEIDFRQQQSIFNSSYTPPAPISTAAPYPGHEDIHAHYMSYQDEYIKWLKKEAAAWFR